MIAQLWASLMALSGGWSSLAGRPPGPDQMTQFLQVSAAMGMDPQMAMVSQWMTGYGTALQGT